MTNPRAGDFFVILFLYLKLNHACIYRALTSQFIAPRISITSVTVSLVVTLTLVFLMHRLLNCFAATRFVVSD